MASGFTLSIQGNKELINVFQKLEKMEEVKDVVRQNGAELQKETQSQMVAKYNKGYSTGATRRSTTLQIGDGGLSATVQPHTEYFPYLELGTRFMSARPTLKPAFQKQSIKFVSDLKGLVK